MKCVVTIALLIPSVVRGATIPSIIPAVDGVLRDGISGPKNGITDSILRNSAVQVLNVDRAVNPFEDRGVIEFGIAGLTPGESMWVLNLPVFSTVGPYPFTVQVFSYAGDGLVSLNEFNAGTLFTSFSYSGESTVMLNVTNVLQSLRSAGSNFAGFNFRMAVATTINPNGPYVAFNSLDLPPAPTIIAVPEPCMPSLAGLGFWGIIRYWRRRSVPDNRT